MPSCWQVVRCSNEFSFPNESSSLITSVVFDRANKTVISLLISMGIGSWPNSLGDKILKRSKCVLLGRIA